MAHGESSRMVKCGHCGAQLPEEWSSKGDEERPPCPNCGSMKIDVSLQIEDSLQLGAAAATTQLGSEEALARWVLDRPPQHGLAIAVRAALRCLRVRPLSPSVCSSLRNLVENLVSSAHDARRNPLGVELATVMPHCPHHAC